MISCFMFARLPEELSRTKFGKSENRFELKKKKDIRLDPCNLTKFEFYARRDTTAIFVNL